MAGACALCGTPLPEGARFCPACAAPVEVAASDERKLATVLFADLVGSTALGEQDPERTRALLDRFYDAMAAEITLAGGTTEKFAGDAVMAAFGAPAAQEDHAERALHAALAMQRRMGELFDGELHLRIGINTGEVVLGRAREGSSFVTGDAVNVAARLEQAANPGQILAGERTVAAARGAFEFAAAKMVEAKGKPGGVACAELVRALSLMRPRGVAGLRSAFVGRDAELELLQATYSLAVAQREPHLVTLMGDAGVGKTRLVRELWQWLATREPQPHQRTGRCLPYGQITYWALGEILKEHLGILDSDPPEITRRRLGDREILGLALGLDVAGDLHPIAARDRLHDAWTAFLEQLVAERPAVLLVEDLHWAEEPLLDLLERVVRDVRGPLLVIGTARPELLDRRPTWGGGRRNTSLVWLEPLSADGSRQLLDELLGSEHPELELIAERSEGNPFFTEELLASLIDQGVLVHEDGSWSVRGLPDDFAVPDSVHALLAARIDLLPAAEKAGLEAAAVIGRLFWSGAVRELLGDGEPDYGLLEDRDFVRRRAGSSMAGETEYAFKHALTRQVAYASLTKGRRARLHAAFGSWLEGLGDRDDFAPLLAYHYAEAVRPADADLAWAGDQDELRRLRAKAVTWLVRASDQAISSYDIDGALAHLRQAAELENTRGGQADLWRRIGHACALKFDGVGFVDALKRAIELCEGKSALADAYSTLVFHTATRGGMWASRPPRQEVGRWLESAFALAEPGTAARARTLIASCVCDKENAEATARAAEASEIAEALDDPVLRSYAWDARGLLAFFERDYEQALTWEQRRFDLLDRISDPDHVHDLYISLHAPTAVLGHFGEARRIAHENWKLTRPLTPHHRLHGVAVLVEVEELVAGWQRLRELRPEVEAAVEENLETPCVRSPRSLLVCAVAAQREGSEAEAAALERDAEALGMKGYDQILDAPRLQLAMARGDLDRLRELIAGWSHEMYWQTWFSPPTITAWLDALALAGERERVEEDAPALLRPRTYFEPFALRALGIVRGDKTLIGQALERFEALGLHWHAEQTRARL